MEKALEMGKTSATGSFQMLIGVAASTIIMALGTIVLGRLLSTDEYGLYGIVLVPATFINLFRDWGVNSAMTKYIATQRATHKEEEIHNFLAAGLIFEVTTGIALSLLSLLLANLIATTVFQRPESASYIAISSVAIISGSLLAVSQASFIGFERMELNSFTLICQAIVKTAVGPALVLLGYSVLGAVIGNVLGLAAAGIIGLATFYFTLYKPLTKHATTESSIRKTLGIMLRYGVPLSIYYGLGGILAQTYALLIIPLTSNTMYGNYLTAFNFSVLLTFLSVPIGTVLFPAFAKLDPDNEHELVRTVFASSVKYTSILYIPATMAMMVLSGPMIGTLYGEKYVYGPFFLTLYVMGNLFTVLGSLSSGGFLSGLGKTTILMTQNIITFIIGIPLGLLLIPTIGIPGLIIASTICGVPSMLWGLYWIWKHYEAKADLKSSTKILAASTLAAATTYLPISLLQTANWIKLVIGLTIFLTVYILGAPIIGAVTTTDIQNIRTMFSGLGTISRIINIPLRAAEKASETKTTRKTRRKQKQQPPPNN
jgi:stage V sporulation protein B